MTHLCCVLHVRKGYQVMVYMAKDDAWYGIVW